MLPLLIAALARASYVGVDLGNGTFKASLVQAGKGPVMLINPQSKRSTPTSLMIQSPPRLVGSPAVSMSGKYPYELVELAHSAAGENCIGEEIPWDREFHPFVIKCDEKTDRWQIYLRNDKMVLFPEEILAHYLSYIKDLAHEHIKEQSSSDVVANAAIKKLEFKLTLPVNASYRKNVAILNAAEIADVKVNPIVISQTAAAAAYHSSDIALEEGQEITKLIVDVGARYAQACQVKYVKPKGKGIQLGIRTTVEQCDVAEGFTGGLVGDWTLGHHVMNQFESKNGRIKGQKRDKALRRVLTAAQKAKHVLSANKTHKIKLENLDGNGNHAELTVSREELEKMLEADGIFSRMEGLISKFDLSQISALEWLGNGWRIPAIQDRLQAKFTTLAFQTTINADESPCLGALYLAAHDAKYKTPKVSMEDISNKNDLMSLNARQIKEGKGHMAQISREDENRAQLDKARNDFEEYLYKAGQLLNDDEKVNPIIEEEKVEISERDAADADAKENGGGLVDKLFSWGGKKETDEAKADDATDGTKDDTDAEEEEEKKEEEKKEVTTPPPSEPISERIPKALKVIDAATEWLAKTEGDAFDKHQGLKYRDEIRDYMEPLTARLKAKKAQAAEERKKKVAEKSAAKEAAKKEKEATEKKEKEDAEAEAEAEPKDGETTDEDKKDGDSTTPPAEKTPDEKQEL